MKIGNAGKAAHTKLSKEKKSLKGTVGSEINKKNFE